MAVQIPDPGTGNGQTGDNEYVFRKKVKDNFSDQTNAASRLVGKDEGQVPVYTGPSGAGGIDNTGVGGAMPTINNFNFGTNTVEGQPKGLGSGFYYLTLNGATNSAHPEAENTLSLVAAFSFNQKLGWRLMQTPYSNKWYLQSSANTSAGPWRKPCEIYHTANTTKDANGFLKAASPIVKVFADKVELNGDAERQNVMYTKNGIGDYTITTVSGLSTDGWYIELPKDMNGNPKVAVTLSEVDGVISLKSYKRIFSMETFTFEPDLDNPLDIPDTRWIDLRLNEIPVEPSEPESEV